MSTDVPSLLSFSKQVINHPNVKEMFSIAHRILGYDLYSKCVDGPLEDLNQTLYAQPAIFVTSLAAVQRLKSENEKVRPTPTDFLFQCCVLT